MFLEYWAYCNDIKWKKNRRWSNTDLCDSLCLQDKDLIQN